MRQQLQQLLVLVFELACDSWVALWVVRLQEPAPRGIAVGALVAREHASQQVVHCGYPHAAVPAVEGAPG
jgi:hypothetical protein